MIFFGLIGHEQPQSWQGVGLHVMMFYFDAEDYLKFGDITGAVKPQRCCLLEKLMLNDEKIFKKLNQW